MLILLPVLIVLILGSGGYAGYLNFYVLPFQQTLVAAEHSFLVEDYDAAIATLTPIAPMTMPKEERYQLARAYVISESLSAEQKELILADITPRTEDNILLYWIQLGREEYTAAIDMAQRINDDELQLYALVKYEVAIQNNVQMSGEEKTELLSTTGSQIEELRKRMEEKESAIEGSGL
jgi:type VII secretion protein EssB